MRLGTTSGTTLQSSMSFRITGACRPTVIASQTGFFQHDGGAGAWWWRKRRSSCGPRVSNFRRITLYAAATDRVAELRVSNHQQEAIDLYFSPQVAQLRSQLHDTITAQAAFQQKRHTQVQEESRAVAARLRNLVIGLGIVGLALGVTVAFFLVRRISHSLPRLTHMIKDIAEGPLRGPARGASTGLS
jgi:hypothetical protein